MVCRVAICDKCGARQLEGEALPEGVPSISRKTIAQSGISIDFCGQCWDEEVQILCSSMIEKYVTFSSRNPFKD